MKINGQHYRSVWPIVLIVWLAFLPLLYVLSIGSAVWLEMHSYIGPRWSLR